MTRIISGGGLVYLEVLVGDMGFHGSEALTYSHDKELPRGSIVVVPLRNALVLGVVVGHKMQTPSFKIKPIREVCTIPLLPSRLIDLAFWMQHYYPAPLGVIASHILPRKLPKKPLDRVNFSQMLLGNLPPLSTDQQVALKAIDDPGTYILHGETGTGKTRVYIELAKRAIASNRSVIILTPEIGLTSQLTADFKQVFAERVTTLHSQLTPVKRQQLWLKLLEEEEPVIVIGPRSALFAPLSNIGLFVIDESHETAYKQDQAPYYHATRVAGQLAALHGAALVLGSATPSVTDYYFADQKKRPIIRMTQAATTTNPVQVAIGVIDLKDRSRFTKRPHISDELIAAMAQALRRNEQTLLFLNRRGTARVVFCTNCGWQADCPHCDLPLVYHGDMHLMRCHTCDFKSEVPVSCPNCHNSSIVFRSVGTKAIVDEVAALFPDARIMRFDTDNKKAERMEHHYDVLKAGEVDVIIGTQTLAKGLDLPKLSVVGVLAADSSLSFPDFSAQERTYQILTQVIGRIGRGHREGRAIIQTYNPDSPLLNAVITKSWDQFYKNELLERKTFMFPPFCFLLKLRCRRASAESALRTAQALVDELRHTDLNILVDGPAPAFHEKIQGKYQAQIVIKSKQRSDLLAVIKRLPSGFSYDIDPLNLL